MRKKFFKPTKIGSSTALIAITSFLSYAIGLVRDAAIADKFGASTATDTYNASFLVPDFLFNLFIAGALTAAFLPVFNEYLSKNKEESRQIANTMLTGASLVIGILAVLAFIFMGKIVPLIFAQATPEMQNDIIGMTRLMLPSAILFAISNTLGNILMSYKHFIAYAISPILYNLGIILGIVFLHDKIGVQSAAVGVLIGSLFHALIRIIDISITDYKFRPQLKVSHPGFKKILRLMVPKSISLIAWQINLYIFTIVGIRLVEGGISAFQYARNIQSFAVSLFGISFATAVFPYLASAVTEDKKQEYTDHMQKTLQRILFFSIPSMIGIMVLSKPLVELILNRGEFGDAATDLTAIILFFFAISIPFEGMSHILARAFYALKNTMTPMLINVTSMAFIAGITIFVAPHFGIEWFSIGFSGGFVLYNILMFIFLRKHLKGFNLKNFAISLTKTLVASGIMAGAIFLSNPISHYLPGKLFNVTQIVIGAITYFLAAFVLKSPEISSINYVLNRIFKKNQA